MIHRLPDSEWDRLFLRLAGLLRPRRRKPLRYLQTVFDSATGLLVARNNPSRSVLIIACTTGSNHHFSPVLRTDTTAGIALSGNVHPLILTHSEHGEICTAEWWLTTFSGVPVVPAGTVIEGIEE